MDTNKVSNLHCHLKLHQLKQEVPQAYLFKEYINIFISN